MPISIEFRFNEPKTIGETFTTLIGSKQAETWRVVAELAPDETDARRFVYDCELIPEEESDGNKTTTALPNQIETGDELMTAVGALDRSLPLIILLPDFGEWIIEEIRETTDSDGRKVLAIIPG